MKHLELSKTARRWAVMGWWAGLIVASGQTGTGPRNFVPNGSFETADGDAPQHWRTQRWGGAGKARYARTGHTGARSVQLESSAGADFAWTTRVPIEPFGHYRLSGWIKTENVQAGSGRGALFNLHTAPGAATPAVTGTRDWTRVSVEFDVDDQDVVQVNCLLGGWGQATGRAWFDDVELVRLADRPRPQPRIAVDAAQVGPPIPVEIYGQFIEHLGRCIYGGIWAEMLEDRKFYYPITARYAPYTALQDTPFPVVGASPWEIVGAADHVRMNPRHPFVGRHSPELHAPVALRQHDLGVTRGQEYTGYVWLRPADGRSVRVAATLSWGEPSADRQTVALTAAGADYTRARFRFTAGATTDHATLELRVREGTALLGAVSLMPADHVDGMRADTLALLRELNAPLYRWPGGNFVSGYDWRDGLGERDRRPPRTNPAWTGVEHNDFGLHEYLHFCRLVGAEPCITVNTGFGDAYSAAAELEYVNGAPTTYYGAQRAAHGHPEPFGVKYWAIGNEMYGPWQLGHMKLDQYVLKHNWVVDRMRAVDPDILCIGSGDAGPWSRGLLEHCADHMELIDEHFYCGEQPSLMAHVRQIPERIRAKAAFHRQMRRELPALKGRDIRIAMMEWNYWYGPHHFGELGTRYFLKDALGIAAGLHEYARNSDIIASAFYAQTVNVIGCIKTSRRHAAFATTGLVLKLYRHHFGTLPVRTTVTGLLDAQAAWSADRRTLTLGVVNASREPVTVPLELAGVRLKGTGRRWQIAGDDPLAYNDPDQPPRVVIEEQPVRGLTNRLSLAPCSVTLFALDVAQP